MSRKAPAVQVYVEDFLGGTKFMSNAEVGLYTRLLFEQADKGHIPDDVEFWVRAYKPECRKLWPAVRAKFVAGPEPGTMLNERMAAAIAAREAFRLKQAEKGKLSAESRFKKSKPRRSHGSTTVEPLGDGVGDISTQEGKERAREKLQAQAKADFIAACKAVVEARPDRLPASLRQGFLDYWTEPNASGKMRFQDQEFFDHGRRMDTWRQRAEKSGDTPAPKTSSTLKPWAN